MDFLALHGHGVELPWSAAVCEGFGMHVVSLHTYPVKGCHRVDHEEITVQPWGVVGDRRWLIVDDDGGAVTQREVPALTGLRANVTPDGGLRLSLPGRDDLTDRRAGPRPAGHPSRSSRGAVRRPWPIPGRTSG